MMYSLMSSEGFVFLISSDKLCYNDLKYFKCSWRFISLELSPESEFDLGLLV